MTQSDVKMTLYIEEANSRMLRSNRFNEIWSVTWTH